MWPLYMLTQNLHQNYSSDKHMYVFSHVYRHQNYSIPHNDQSWGGQPWCGWYLQHLQYLQDAISHPSHTSPVKAHAWATPGASWLECNMWLQACPRCCYHNVLSIWQWHALGWQSKMITIVPLPDGIQWCCLCGCLLNQAASKIWELMQPLDARRRLPCDITSHILRNTLMSALWDVHGMCMGC